MLHTRARWVLLGNIGLHAPSYRYSQIRQLSAHMVCVEKCYMRSTRVQHACINSASCVTTIIVVPIALSVVNTCAIAFICT